MNNMLDYLNKIGFKQSLEKKVKKYKNKKIVIYGAGSFFEVINNNFDLSQLNIIGICDKRFDANYQNEMFLGYKVIKYDDLAKCMCDCILVSTLKYIPIIDELSKIVKNKKLAPLVNRPIKELLIEIFR